MMWLLQHILCFTPCLSQYAKRGMLATNRMMLPAGIPDKKLVKRTESQQCTTYHEPIFFCTTYYSAQLEYGILQVAF